MTAFSDLPLFPLPLVLFPGAGLPLRIFESRYLEMVRECCRTQTGFGVIRHHGAGASPDRSHAVVGTEALIEDFSTLSDGLLGIQCRGYRRFRLRSTRARDDGLLIGQGEWLAEEPRRPVPPEHGVLQSVLREILRQEVFQGVVRGDPDEAGSLGMALAAVLPLDDAQAQVCLEMTDPIARLDHLAVIVEQVSGDQ